MHSYAEEMLFVSFDEEILLLCCVQRKTINDGILRMLACITGLRSRIMADAKMHFRMLKKQPHVNLASQAKCLPGFSHRLPAGAEKPMH